MECTEEALALAINTAQAAARPETVDTHNPRQVVMLHGTDVTRLDVPPPVRESLVYSLATLIEVATNADIAPNPVVWHCNAGVEVVLDDSDRRDVVLFPLANSREFSKLIELDCELIALDQRSFVRMLRQTLGVPADQVGPFRRMEWTVHKAASGQIDHGKDRQGRQIMAQVAEGIALPENMVLNVPVYEQMGERDCYQVRCDIEIDVMGERFALVPVAGEIRSVIDMAQQSIHERLKVLAGDVPVYYGRAKVA